MASGLDLYFVLAGVLQEPTALLVLLSPRGFHQRRYFGLKPRIFRIALAVCCWSIGLSRGGHCGIGRNLSNTI